MKKYLIVLVVVIVFGLFLDHAINITQLPLILKGVVVVLMLVVCFMNLERGLIAGFSMLSCAIVYLISMRETLVHINDYTFIESYALSAFMLTLAYVRLTKTGGEE